MSKKGTKTIFKNMPMYLKNSKMQYNIMSGVLNILGEGFRFYNIILCLLFILCKFSTGYKIFIIKMQETALLQMRANFIANAKWKLSENSNKGRTKVRRPMLHRFGE